MEVITRSDADRIDSDCLSVWQFVFELLDAQVGHVDTEIAAQCAQAASNAVRRILAKDAICEAQYANPHEPAARYAREWPVYGMESTESYPTTDASV